jgi:cellulose synthase/poly-beta-1,6-N-acetylglucosamine synthase-like glycosyltransferase
LRSLLRFLPRREQASFLAIGLSGALIGHFILVTLIGAGWMPALANTAQVLVTLQWNFVANRELTWRRGTTGRARSLLASWWRFHTARGASTALGLLAFPGLAGRIGAATAYWLLLAVSAVINYASDKHWSFHGAGQHRRRTGPLFRLALGIAAVAAAALLTVALLDPFIVLVSLFMLVVAITTLAFQLYKWWSPQHNDPHRYGEPDEPRLSGVVLVPMRHEEAVAEQTLERLANLRHADYLVVPIIDHPDDPGTAAIANAMAQRYPDRIMVCRYPEDTDTHNKPTGLNAAVAMLHERGLAYDWVGVADGEDLFHPDLLRMVDYRFRTTGAGIVQCGVQLMNFSSDPRGHALPDGPFPRLRRWWHANATAWWRTANVLEYFKWFQSRLKLQAAIGVMPLGGNTVFFRREFLEALRAHSGNLWDEDCLTEDCKIGILASTLGYRVDVVYVAEMVTREETPHSLGAFVRQRVRWMQGFIQVFREGDWLRLPTITQRVLAVYVLGFQFFQAAAGLLAPVALIVALAHKAPVVIALLATLPLGLSILAIVLDVLLLAQFSRTFGEKARLRDYAGVVLGAYPYQVVLSVAAIWAICRFLLGRNNWVKTAHHGIHLRPRTSHSATVERAAVPT